MFTFRSECTQSECISGIEIFNYKDEYHLMSTLYIHIQQFQSKLKY